MLTSGIRQNVCNNQKDLPRDCKADKGTYCADPRVWEPGLPSPDAHTPLALQLCAHKPLWAQDGFLLLPCSTQVRFADGR